jgi:hypothetical protein
MRTALFIFFFLVAATSSAVNRELRVPTVAQSKLNYAWISFLTEGPVAWISDTPARGRYLRFVVYGQVEEMPSTFRIETITYGDEGCCRRLTRARQFDIAKPMKETFGPFPSKDQEFHFVRWLNETSIEFDYFGKRFVLTDLDKNSVRIKNAADR